MDKKKILLIGSIVLIVASFVVSILLLVNKPEENEFIIEGINLPTNREILKDKVVGDLKITNVSLLIRSGVSTFKAKVTNESEEEVNFKKLTVIFYEGENEKKVDVLRNTTISSGESKYINLTSEMDMTNVDKIEYVLE